MSKPNEKKAEQLVDDLLESFRQDNTTTLRGSVSLQDEPDVRLEIDFTGMDSPEDGAAILSIIISIMGTMFNSSFTGFARAAHEDMLPELIRHMEKHNDDIQSKHIAFVKRLIEPMFQSIEDKDNKASFDEVRLPFNIRNTAHAMAALGMVMYTAGQNSTALDFDTGYKATLARTIQAAMKNAGVVPNVGSVNKIIGLAVDDAIKGVKAHHEQRTQKGD
jgi:hypothetical protein